MTVFLLIIFDDWASDKQGIVKNAIVESFFLHNGGLVDLLVAAHAATLNARFIAIRP